MSTLNAASSQDLYLPVINVYDGDTIETRLPLPEPLDKAFVRLYGIDTPEFPAKSYQFTGKLGRAKCVKEAELAIKAKELVENIISKNGNMLLLRDFQYDKYGGRILANVYVIDSLSQLPINIADKLIESGLAVEYSGNAKTTDWCE